MRLLLNLKVFNMVKCCIVFMILIYLFWVFWELRLFVFLFYLKLLKVLIGLLLLWIKNGYEK